MENTAAAYAAAAYALRARRATALATALAARLGAALRAGSPTAVPLGARYARASARRRAVVYAYLTPPA